jgi:2-desacetyl-2-hydroxyethyl bacteriochlorophyllide A dehydrogenase
MQALVFRGPGVMTVEHTDRPVARPGQVVVGVTAAGICGSELTSFTGASTRRPPGRVFGHEFAGTVLRSGDAAGEALVGERVVVNPLIPCGTCRLCQRGRSNVCPSRTLLGMQVDGGFAEEVAVPISSVRALEELDDVAGSLVEPIANAVHVSGLLPGIVGRHLAVMGAGPIGLSVIAVLALAGAGQITAMDPVPFRRELAIAAGADVAIAPEDRPSSAPDHIVDAAGVTSARSGAIELCEDGGTVILLGLHTAESTLPMNLAIAKELRLQCAYAYTPEDFETAFTLMRRGAIPYEPWVVTRPLSEGQQAFEQLVERPGEAAKIVMRPT